MKLEEFVTKFAAEFDETPVTEFTSDTNYKQMEEWSSLTALSLSLWLMKKWRKE